MNIETINGAWLALCAALVLIMQGGFCCLESGLVRSKNSINVAIKNLMDFCWASVIYFAFGFAVMFGISYSGWFGTSGFFLDTELTPALLAFFVLQLLYCSTTTTIVSGAVAERMRFTSYMCVVTIVAGLIYPFIGHWVWAGVQFGTSFGWLAQMGFIDVAGSTVVHSTGGWAALAAAIVVGARLGRFEEDGPKLHGHNLPMAVLGVMLIWFGWIGFNGGSLLEVNQDIPLIVANTCLAAVFGGATALTISWVVYQRSDVSVAMNGIIAGLVSVTGACNLVSPAAAVAIGTVGAIVCMAATVLLQKLRIDDVIGAFPAHGCAGMWGTIAVAIFAPISVFGDDVSRVEQFGIQALGVLACCSWTFGMSLSLFIIVNRILPLRVSEDDEKIGLNVSEHNASTEMLDLLKELESHRPDENPQVDEPQVVANDEKEQEQEQEQPTEAGQIAALYHRMAGAAERERKAAGQVRRSEQRIRAIIDSANDAFIAMNRQGEVSRWNAAAEKFFGWSHDEAIGSNVASLMLTEQLRCEVDLVEQLLEHAHKGERFEMRAGDRNNREFPVEVSASIAILDNETTINLFVQDITQRQQMQQQLAQSQKLESLGQLAAGIAHEINTPTQFVGDNAQFLKEAFEDWSRIIDAFCKYLDADKSGHDTAQLVGEIEELIEEIELDYLKDEIPTAIDQSLDGVSRLANIVRAMKQFSHPGGAVKERVDLNKSIENTIVVSRNEWKYVAELHADFDEDLPLVQCFQNEINQVVLNMIVNASHAIQEKLGDKPKEKGNITISTRLVGDSVEIRVADDGPGIPEEIRKKVFDPFFTTKGVGRGTGQGLSIAYSAIVDKHGGSVNLETEEGKGTTFILRLPLEPTVVSV